MPGRAQAEDETRLFRQTINARIKFNPGGLLGKPVITRFRENLFRGLLEPVMQRVVAKNVRLADVPFHIHRIGDQYWNDVGSLAELKSGTFDILTGELELPSVEGTGADSVHTGAGTTLGADVEFIAPVWVGENVTIGAGARLTGPVVIGDGATIGAGAKMRDSIVYPGTTVTDEAIVIGASLGQTGIIAAMKPRG